MNLELYKKGTYSFERRIDSTLQLNAEEKKASKKRKSFWEKLIHKKELSDISYFSAFDNADKIINLLSEKNFYLQENEELDIWEKLIKGIDNGEYQDVKLPTFKWLNPENNKLEENPPFLSFFIPFLKYAKGKLEEECEKNEVKVLFNSALEKDMIKILLSYLHRTCMRALILELNVCREEGLLKGDSPNERMQFYSDTLLKSKTYVNNLLCEYPVLYRLMAVGINNWICNMKDLLIRFKDDKCKFGEIVKTDNGHISIVGLSGDMSDSHNGGAGVLKLLLNNNETIIYKPRSLKLDLQFNNLVEWYNSHSVRHKVYQTKIIDMKEYGWMEFIRNEVCETEDAYSV